MVYYKKHACGCSSEAQMLCFGLVGYMKVRCKEHEVSDAIDEDDDEASADKDAALFTKLNEGTKEYENWLKEMGWYDERVQE